MNRVNCGCSERSVMFYPSQWAYSLVKDGKLLYDAEKLKRESFGKLFSE